MPSSDPSLTEALRSAVQQAATRPEVRQAVESVYRDLAADVDNRRPLCVISGRCCRFEEFGHRLYVTTMELAAFLAGFEANPPTGSLATSIERWDGTGCPFQVAKMCGVHAMRPFGCRMFFCDATSTDWQNQAYELYHGRLKRLHEQLAVPYFYVEWREAIRAVMMISPVEP